VKAIRKMVDSNKGFYTFWLIMVFLSALFVRNIAGIIPVKSDKEKVEHTEYKYDITATADDDSGSDSFDRFDKGFDPDDTEFILFENPFSKLTFSFQEKAQFKAIDLQKQTYNNALYDLYCNWKFHLS